MKPATRIRFTRNEAKPVTDASGTEFDPACHVAPDDFTNAGLFRLKPGKRRS
ncbi:hypothetical protein [Coraliomargarita sinensis]|uniref:hypothetical protein n=1 Tax=Coraliomargarita sinensis TaxID=2174842 RepID=UPI001304A1A3|nr:hypothetical protein [Coraliomargarita sinensis]